MNREDYDTLPAAQRERRALFAGWCYGVASSLLLWIIVQAVR